MTFRARGSGDHLAKLIKLGVGAATADERNPPLIESDGMEGKSLLAAFDGSLGFLTK
jgi:hypothetical protein